MYIIADHRIPIQAKKELSLYGEIIPFHTQGITYDAISGHPDIFFTQTPNALIAAPNTPKSFLTHLYQRKIPYLQGETPVGNKAPNTFVYNAVCTSKYLIHHLKYTDPILLDNALHHIPIQVPQGYTRCNLIPLTNDWFITSDKSIENQLLKNGLSVLYVSPTTIQLPSMPYGFIGGTSGIVGHTIFFIGQLSSIPQGELIYHLLSSLGYTIIELGNSVLFDGGSLFFINT